MINIHTLMSSRFILLLCDECVFNMKHHYYRGVARALFCIRQLGLPYNKAKILKKIRQLKKKEKRKERKKERGKTKLTFWQSCGAARFSAAPAPTLQK